MKKQTPETFHSRSRLRVLFTVLMIFSMPSFLRAQQDRSLSPEAVIATVNGEALTAADLKLTFFAKQLTEESSIQAKDELIKTLIDRELVRQFLEKRKIKADSILLQQRINAVRDLVNKKGDELTEVLNKAGLTEESLSQLISQQIIWKTYVNSVLTETKVEQFWQENKERFDGTEVVASQIFKRLPASATADDVRAAMKELYNLKERIERKDLSFAEAATKHSESPSAKSGGTLGVFEFYGRVAEPIAVAVFSTPPGSVSEPFRSRYGVHIVEVQKKTSGEYSLEDARPQVIEILSENLWDELTAKLRKSARIQIHN